jgi:thioredoxin 1
MSKLDTEDSTPTITEHSNNTPLQKELDELHRVYERKRQAILDKYKGGKGGKGVEDVEPKPCVVKVDDHTTFKRILDSDSAKDKLIVVDFTATWCGPCKRIAPTYENLSKEFGNVAVFLKVDVDDNDETTASCKIKSMPTFLYYKNGEKIDEGHGADPDQLREKIEKNI